VIHIPTTQRPERNEWVLQFINIVFLILLFFLVNATIQAPPPQQISPPVSVTSEIAAPPAGALFINENGQMIWQDKPLNAAEFQTLKNNPPKALYSDRNLKAQTLISLMAQLRKAGLPPIPLVTVRRTP
jgi:biopolymer transport protein ExbD